MMVNEMAAGMDEMMVASLVELMVAMKAESWADEVHQLSHIDPVELVVHQEICCCYQKTSSKVQIELHLLM
jgi:hypothetical protein